jgi:hypothetical protein
MWWASSSIRTAPKLVFRAGLLPNPLMQPTNAGGRRSWPDVEALIGADGRMIACS